jgi:hypothetical protein
VTRANSSMLMHKHRTRNRWADEKRSIKIYFGISGVKTLALIAVFTRGSGCSSFFK